MVLLLDFSESRSRLARLVQVELRGMPGEERGSVDTGRRWDGRLARLRRFWDGARLRLEIEWMDGLGV